MPASTNTGPTVPAWIRERIDLHEQHWPLAVLAAGAALSILVALILGVLIWTADPAVYYARP